MKLGFPDEHFAKLAQEGYAGDGVRGEVGYDEKDQQWYLDLNDQDYKKYQQNLRMQQVVILNRFGKSWKGVNIQALAEGPPRENENRLALYLIDNSCGTAHGFKVVASAIDVANRKRAFMQFGSTCESCGKKMSVVLTWEDVKPKKEVRNG